MFPPLSGNGPSQTFQKPPSAKTAALPPSQSVMYFICLCQLSGRSIFFPEIIQPDHSPRTGYPCCCREPPGRTERDFCVHSAARGRSGGCWVRAAANDAGVRAGAHRHAFLEGTFLAVALLGTGVFSFRRKGQSVSKVVVTVCAVYSHTPCRSVAVSGARHGGQTIM